MGAERGSLDALATQTLTLQFGGADAAAAILGGDCSGESELLRSIRGQHSTHYARLTQLQCVAARWAVALLAGC
jgi:hypothetical protein